MVKIAVIVSLTRDTILNVSNTELEFIGNVKNYTMVKLTYDHCMIRFSNESYIGKMRGKSFHYSGSPRIFNNATLGNKIRFFDVLSDVLNHLPVQAASDESGKRFATKVVNLSKFESLSTMAQCTWDITPCDCNACLSKLTAELLRMIASHGSSGRADSDNCILRYESLAMNDFTLNDSNGPLTGDIQAIKPEDAVITHEGIVCIVDKYLEFGAGCQGSWQNSKEQSWRRGRGRGRGRYKENAKL